MAKIEKHEKINEHIEYVDKDFGSKRTVQVFSLAGDENAQLKHADRLVREGHRRVEIVTERWTWRGKNGKITKEELSREPVVLALVEAPA